MTPQSKLLLALNRAVGQGVFPGAVLLVSYRGQVRFHEAVGFSALRPRKVRMTRSTVFDLASLTKPMATTMAVMCLVDRGILRLEDPVSRWFPEFSGDEKGRVTLRMLLSHSSGLRAWEPIYKKVILQARGRKGFIGSREAAQFVLDRVLGNRLVYSPGTKSLYSDLGFILLGAVIERAGGLPLDRFCRQNVFRPLGMKRTFYIPRRVKRRGPFAATERCAWRKRIIVGEVHDDQGYCMGGVAGHVGLFATAMDINRFAQMMLDGFHGRSSFIPQKVLKTFVTRQAIPNSSRALGWDTPSGSSSSGRHTSRHSFGHLGYTGTSMWIDPDLEWVTVLLTNRVHPTSRNIKIGKFRPMIHDLVYKELIGGLAP